MPKQAFTAQTAKGLLMRLLTKLITTISLATLCWRQKRVPLKHPLKHLPQLLKPLRKFISLICTIITSPMFKRMILWPPKKPQLMPKQPLWLQLMQNRLLQFQPMQLAIKVKKSHPLMVSQQKLSKNKLKSLRPLKRRVILKMPKKPPRMQLQMPHKKRKSLKKLKNKLKLEKRKKQNKLKNSEIMPKLRPTNLKKRKLPETSSLVVTDPMEKEHLKKLPRKS